MKLRKSFSVIIINYHSKKWLNKCLSSLSEAIRYEDDVEIIIVNNEKKQLRLPGHEKLNIKIIELAKNVGFAKAANKGAGEAKNELLFFLNPDTEISKNAFSLAKKILAEDPAIGIIGPRLYNPLEKRNDPWTSGKKATLANLLFKSTFNKPWKNNKQTEADWVSGTALITRKSDFEKIRGFDGRFFMYFEDQDLCLRMKKLGKKVVYTPSIIVNHYSGKSWRNKQEKKRHYRKSQVSFFKKHHAPFQHAFLKTIYSILKLDD